MKANEVELFGQEEEEEEIDYDAWKEIEREEKEFAASQRDAP